MPRLPWRNKMNWPKGIKNRRGRICVKCSEEVAKMFESCLDAVCSSVKYDIA
jgi:hypothetical protein